MRQEQIIVRAHGKINWTLDVFEKRTDGFHEIATVMQRVELADQLSFSRAGRGIKLSIFGPEANGVPADSRNIVWRAAQLLGIDGVEILIEKNIPHQSGLGGGSSDAAAALSALSSLFKLSLSDKEMLEIAGLLGADVPFFLSGGPAMVRGFGELVTPIDAIQPIDLVILRPDVGVSTADAYAALDLATGRTSHNGTERWPHSSPSNDFEDVVYSLYPAVLAARQLLLKAGASQAMLCGSGSAVMGWGENMATVAANLRATGHKHLWTTRTI